MDGRLRGGFPHDRQREVVGLLFADGPGDEGFPGADHRMVCPQFFHEADGRMM